jgi:hypothetical protein
MTLTTNLAHHAGRGQSRTSSHRTSSTSHSCNHRRSEGGCGSKSFTRRRAVCRSTGGTCRGSWAAACLRGGPQQSTVAKRLAGCTACRRTQRSRSSGRPTSRGGGGSEPRVRSPVYGVLVCGVCDMHLTLTLPLLYAYVGTRTASQRSISQRTTATRVWWRVCSRQEGIQTGRTKTGAPRCPSPAREGTRQRSSC